MSQDLKSFNMSKILLILAGIVILVLAYFLLKPINDGRSSEVKIQNNSDKSEAYERKIRYLIEEGKVKDLAKDSSDKRAEFYKSELEKFKKFIESKNIKMHEKYTAIGNLNGIGTYNFFARIETGDSLKRK